jgi:hypothetical protein
MYFLVSFSTSHAGINTPWRDFSDPSIMDENFVKSFAQLPLTGAAGDPLKLWANDYWPNKRGSINYRWNSPQPKGFDLHSPSREEALSMGQDYVAMLSPSEKLDLLNGRYDFPLRKEVESISNPSTPIWHGICNGWAPAALNHNEPTPKTLKNADGVVIPFGSSDIKALLSYYYAFKHDVDSTHQMGKRCNYYIGPNCDDDLNAGSFHVVLTNKVGLQKGSFIADVERSRQVWNHTVNKYETTIISDNLAPARESAPGTVRRVRVQTVMWFVSSIKANNWNPVKGTADHVDDVRNYEYFLELDSAGSIIGGEWISKARPDFLWTMAKATQFQGNFVRMPELLND